MSCIKSFDSHTFKKGSLSEFILQSLLPASSETVLYLSATAVVSTHDVYETSFINGADSLRLPHANTYTATLFSSTDTISWCEALLLCY